MTVRFAVELPFKEKGYPVHTPLSARLVILRA